jgi:hypothetical protein
MQGSINKKEQYKMTLNRIKNSLKNLKNDIEYIKKVIYIF